ncbi:BTAD domain-containing putative transcriptional regulator [Microlunatus soli]|uniref:Predicted ATPase n=1 Tax=Microlunatus soli TaxID=630515 RepID=A0A1H1RA14_9ACTN|nr:BTAD domain-containing putative transcriptional regulator [Microlunatus soli]SDS32356.1 Predicted ATPase [Microlunatus soli]
MHYDILGPLRVRTTDGEHVAVAGARQRSLLSLLALTPGRPVSVEELLTGQYEEDPPAEATNAIQAQISRLRRSLPPGSITFEAGRYRLHAQPEDVDVCRFERLSSAGHDRLQAGDATAAARLLQNALDLWRGPALSDVAGADAVIARLDEARLVASEDLVEAELALPSGTSVADLRALVEAHPLRERLWGLLMRALVAAGSPAEALSEYERARNLLAEELGTDPSPDLRAIHQEILRRDEPGWRSVPLQSTSFVGRSVEIDAVLADADAGRLVTVIGPGGVGKTRLAIEAADRIREPVAFVDLAAVSTDRQVVPAVLAALGRRDPLAGADDAADSERLAASLSTQHMVLLLDNCEHVVGGVLRVCRSLLSGSRGVRVIATSRVALGLTEELLVPLSGLAADSVSGAGSTGDPAVRLFTDRAVAVQPGFSLDDESRSAVREICAELDGLPLAIELAAARTRQFSTADLARRLIDQGRLQLLRGDPTAAERHQTLRAVVQWSWDLMSADQQRLARRLSVFVGGADFAAVEAVYGAEDADLLLAELVDHSLVETDGHRYRMLETVRSFCAEQLSAAGEDEPTRHRHAGYFLDRAERADPELRRADQLVWLDRLAVDDANLTAALEWTTDNDPPTAMRLVCVLAAYWWLSGRNGRAGEFAAELVGRLDDVGPPAGLEEEYVSCVVHAVPRASEEHWERAIAIMATRDRPLRHPFGAALWGMTVGPSDDTAAAEVLLSGDPWNHALARLSRVLLGMLGGRPEREEPEMRAALEEFRRLGDRWGTAQALDWLGQMTSWRGAWPAAHELWSEAFDLQSELGALEECASVLCHRAESMVREGRGEEAAALVDRAQQLLQRTGRPDDTWVQFLLSFGEVARLRGDTDEAARLIRKASVAADAGTLDVPWMAARIHTELGRLAELGQAPAEAERQHAAAVELAAAAPFASELAHAAEGAAGSAVLADHPERAARLLGAATSLRGLAIRGDVDVARISAAATDHLGPEAFARIFAEAARLDPESARDVVTAVEQSLDQSRNSTRN